MRTIYHALVVGVLFAALPHGAAHAAKLPLCDAGRFLQTAPIAGDSALGAFDTIELADGNLSIASGCAATTAKLKARKKATQVVVKWPSCGALQNVRLTGTITTDGSTACGRFKGVLKAKKTKPRKILALRSACGDGKVDAALDETCDPPASGTCSSTCQSQGAISAPAGQWTWIPFGSEAQCANGSSTGIGVNLSTTSSRVLIFMMGGGACWDETSCYQVKSASNIEDGYGEEKFATEAASLLRISVFNRDDANNPFKDYSFVYVPYCTGDVHGGSNPDAVYGGKATKHIGYLNMGKYLARIVPTFPDTTRVVLSGSSAGGFGALTNWYRTQQAFGDGVRVDLVDDSGPTLPAPYLSHELQTTWANAWNLAAAIPPACTGCLDDLDAAWDFSAMAMPNNRAALLSYTNDAIIGGFFQINGTQVSDGLQALWSTRIHPHAGNRVFYKTGATHTMLFVLDTTESNVTLREFLTKMESDDVSWADVMPTP